MLKIDDLEDRAVDVDVIAVLELVGTDDGRSTLPRARLNVVRLRLELVAAWSR
jgi:hypothetical protein